MSALLQFLEQIRDVDSAIEYLRTKNILARNGPMCPRDDCNRVMTQIRAAQHRKDKYIWRCPLHKGRKVSLRANSFISKSHLELNQFVLLCYTWALGIRCVTQEVMVSLSKSTIIDFNGFFRKVCTDWLNENPIKLGGPDLVVEIDESLFLKKKYHQREQIVERWIFKLYDVKARIGVLVLIEDRSKETLLPIIKKVVRPGSIIHSCNRAAYECGAISAIPVYPPYKHMVVNETFANSNNGATINHALSFWKRAKCKIKAVNCSTTESLPSYLDEIMWRQIYGGYTLEAYENLLYQISVLHPVNSSVNVDVDVDVKLEIIDQSAQGDVYDDVDVKNVDIKNVL